MVYLGGPFHGMKWRTTDVITHMQFGFNSCHCNLIAGTFSTPVTLAEPEPVSLTSVSAI